MPRPTRQDASRRASRGARFARILDEPSARRGEGFASREEKRRERRRSFSCCVSMP